MKLTHGPEVFFLGAEGVNGFTGNGHYLDLQIYGAAVLACRVSCRARLK